MKLLGPVRREVGQLTGSARSSVSDESLFGAKVSLYVRWFGLLWGVVIVNYRPDELLSSHILNNLYAFSLLTFNGYVHFRLLTGRKILPGWMFALSVMDMIIVGQAVIVEGGYESPYFIFYYPALAWFAAIFTSARLTFGFTTLVAAAYVVLCLVTADGVNLGAKEDLYILARIVAMYSVVTSVNLITRFERIRRQAAVERERDLQRQRIELSQTIHDTTAQSLYMIGIGIESAAEMAQPVNSPQIDKLKATNALTKSVMWDLRHPIDAGLLLQGRRLDEVLQSHVDTFTSITSLPAKFILRGREPSLSDAARNSLFSIGHNAMTNALRHSQASNVTVELVYYNPGIRISVSDDGIGLPHGYANRSHGFSNMIAEAKRLGGRLEAGPGPGGRGTTVSCIVD